MKDVKDKLKELLIDTLFWLLAFGFTVAVVAFTMFHDVYASTNDTAITEFPIIINIEETDKIAMYVKPEQGVNVRQFAILESNKIDTLSYNTEVQVIYQTVTGWSAIYHEGRLRYISTECLSVEKMPEIKVVKPDTVNNNTTSSNDNETVNASTEISNSTGTYLGNFKITHYCACSQCNGSWGNITATGVTPQVGRTIAVDRNVIPLGSRVMINGHVYIAEDVGGFSGHHIDMFVGSHSEALNRGVTYADVYLLQ